MLNANMKADQISRNRIQQGLPCLSRHTQIEELRKSQGRLFFRFGLGYSTGKAIPHRAGPLGTPWQLVIHDIDRMGKLEAIIQ